MRTRDKELPWILLGDWNAHIGMVCIEGIGDLHADPEDVAGMRMRDLVAEWRLVVPSTFSQWHLGETRTFISASGGR